METNENNGNNSNPRPLWKRIFAEIYELLEAIFIIIGNILRGVFNDMRHQPRVLGKLLSLIVFMVFYLLFSWLFSNCENCQ